MTNNEYSSDESMLATHFDSQREPAATPRLAHPEQNCPSGYATADRRRGSAPLRRLRGSAAGGARPETLRTVCEINQTTTFYA